MAKSKKTRKKNSRQAEQRSNGPAKANPGKANTESTPAESAKTKPATDRPKKSPGKDSGKGSSQASGKPGLFASHRAVLKSSLGVGVAIAGGAWIHRYDKQKRETHDLSAIGAGSPVVVQVHDPSCPSCRALMRSTKAALQSKPSIVYRVADLTTPEGRSIGDQYGVGKVTLLLFAADGKRVGTVQGVQPASQLLDTFTRYFPQS